MKRQPSATRDTKRERLAILWPLARESRPPPRKQESASGTAHTWLEDAHFRFHVTEVRGQMLDAALGRLSASATKAVETLVEVLEKGQDNARVRAALGILQTLTKINEQVDLTRRIAALEAAYIHWAAEPTTPPRPALGENGQKTP